MHPHKKLSWAEQFHHEIFALELDGEEDSEEDTGLDELEEGDGFPLYIIGIVVPVSAVTLITTIIVAALCIYMKRKRKIKHLKR